MGVELAFSNALSEVTLSCSRRWGQPPRSRTSSCSCRCSAITSRPSCATKFASISGSRSSRACSDSSRPRRIWAIPEMRSTFCRASGQARFPTRCSPPASSSPRANSLAARVFLARGPALREGGNRHHRRAGGRVHRARGVCLQRRDHRHLAARPWFRRPSRRARLSQVRCSPPACCVPWVSRGRAASVPRAAGADCCRRSRAASRCRLRTGSCSRRARMLLCRRPRSSRSTGPPLPWRSCWLWLAW